ncbi:hypothetical protein CRENBAI_003652 [Crenichthys baileyi]|uniref:Uncharacterized protein n=1 Tax=Crenichthys baileyi TaxID=28760 RepID=A0AAV9RBM9_9TELE
MILRKTESAATTQKDGRISSGSCLCASGLNWWDNASGLAFLEPNLPVSLNVGYDIPQGVGLRRESGLLLSRVHTDDRQLSGPGDSKYHAGRSKFSGLDRRKVKAKKSKSARVGAIWFRFGLVWVGQAG